jgi:hypothetical protein
MFKINFSGILTATWGSETETYFTPRLFQEFEKKVLIGLVNQSIFSRGMLPMKREATSPSLRNP